MMQVMEADIIRINRYLVWKSSDDWSTFIKVLVFSRTDSAVVCVKDQLGHKDKAAQENSLFGSKSLLIKMISSHW